MNVQESIPLSDTAAQDPLALLAADHEQISLLFEQFEEALEEESGNLKQIAEQIFQQLEIHTAIEEEIFYPAVDAHTELSALVQEALSEHAEVKEAIEKARTLEADDPEFATTMLSLMDDVDKHVGEEENMLFPQVEAHLDDELESLAERLLERKRELQASY